MPPRKNKRGARGSTEEDPNAAKRLNMASKEEEAAAAEEEIAHGVEGQEEREPSLLEIKALLIDIQTSIVKLTEENETLRKEVSDLKASLEFNDKELRDVKSSLATAASAYASLQKKLDATNNELNAAKNTLKDQRYETQRLENSLDTLEQYTRKNSLEIHGIPENLYPNTQDAVIKVAEALNVTIVPSEIEICHKLKRNKGPQPILVKFLSHQIKSKLYKERTKLKNVKISDIYPSYSSPVESRIFIHENLTSYRKEVVAEANRRRRDGTLLSIWTLDGKIYVKTSPTGSPKKIYYVEDLDYI